MSEQSQDKSRGHVTSTVEVEYIDSGTFVGGEEDAFIAGIKTGDTCHVITTDCLEGLFRERDGLKAEVERLRDNPSAALVDDLKAALNKGESAEMARLRAENAELAATLRATRASYLELVSADEELVEGFVSIGDTVPPELLPNLRAMKKALTEALAAPATTEPAA